MSATANKVVRLPPRPQAATGEAQWVASARDGDRRAFGHLYRRYVRLVHGIILSRVPIADVPDLVQDVFTQALDRLSTLAQGAPFGPWVAAIARHRAIDHLRSRRPSVPWDDGLRASPAHAPEAHEALRMILSLPEVYRETMVLRLIEGMQGPEIAERTGLTRGSVRVKLCRGMKLLRRRLQQERP